TPGGNNDKRSSFLKDYYYYDVYHKRKLILYVPCFLLEICIIGAGMSGLFSSLLLKKAGTDDITILEYQDRVGG
ncbi:24896_t:CDS:2, partial [Gigaspora rosea]